MMDNYQNWEEQKRALETEENVRRKVAAIFSVAQSAQVFALLETLGDLQQPRLVLDILRRVELRKGSDKLEKLKQAIATALQDPRDIWVVEYGRDFSVSCGMPQKEKSALQTQDAQEHLDWLLK